MEVLKVVAEGITTSFRYPHFMQAIQPSFEMPPPATIYGHICSALGDWVDPKGVRFAIRFSFEAQFEDIEHIHILSVASGKMKGSNIPKVLEGQINPFTRRLLYRPRLILYINRPDWIGAFRSPRYPVVLGRSQDLFTYSSVEILTLLQSQNCYLENTLVSGKFDKRTVSGYVVLMPRFLDYRNIRTPTFTRYVVLHRRVFSSDLLRYVGEEKSSFWVDPTTPEVNGSKLGLIFHSWTDE